MRAVDGRWVAAIGAILALSPPLAAAQSEAGAAALRVEASGGKGWRLEAPLLLASRLEGAGGYAIDRSGGRDDGGAWFAAELRAGLRADSGATWDRLVLSGEIEGEVATRFLPDDTALDGEVQPDALRPVLRKAYARVSFMRFLNLGGGVMTSHWGLGLVANDGAHGWTPGSARFADPRGGDRELRGFVAIGLSEELGALALFAVDRVLGDDVLLDGDDATQLVFALQAGRGKRHSGGLYLVRRSQDATSGRGLRATVIDVTGASSLDVGSARVGAGVEAALVLGSTTLAPTVDRREHDLRQLGVAARATVDRGRLGGALDLLYASGDDDLYDGAQTAFKPDPNFDLGLLLYRRVLASQTGRAPSTAGDPLLVGEPPEDLDRFPTRGSASATVAVFPRGLVRPLAGVEIYGGPLLAWSAGGPIDPLATTAAGGSPRNALGGRPGAFMGAEIDLGARWRGRLGALVLTAGLEAGILFPGSALADPAGQPMAPVAGGRALLRGEI